MQKNDKEIESLIGKNCDRATKILNENKDILHKLAELLLEKETATGSELDDLIRAMKPGIEFSA